MHTESVKNQQQLEQPHSKNHCSAVAQAGSIKAPSRGSGSGQLEALEHSAHLHWAPVAAAASGLDTCSFEGAGHCPQC